VFSSSYGEERVPASTSSINSARGFEEKLPLGENVYRIDFTMSKFMMGREKNNSRRFLHSFKIYGRDGRLIFNKGVEECNKKAEYETKSIHIDKWKKVVGVEIAVKNLVDREYRTSFQFLCVDL